MIVYLRGVDVALVWTSERFDLIIESSSNILRRTVALVHLQSTDINVDAEKIAFSTIITKFYLSISRNS